MSETNDERSTTTAHDPDDEKQQIDEVQRRLDEESGKEGLAAEEGTIEENGISEG